ncbi:unnamed protein product [Cyprideis torosa]|uniref:Uncharacterized protein n=1 Tax=Cyprideis torosa TaxID=163714 RepID=A0A7R8WBQ2_9CRUS|nr:unnamed protein product [Cyprideis torosa]CAG0887233.1 unnamed protein product [Cyprideis torosa]
MATRRALRILFLVILLNADFGKAEFEIESPGNTEMSDEAQEEPSPAVISGVLKPDELDLPSLPSGFSKEFEQTTAVSSRNSLLTSSQIAQICRIVEERKACEKIVQLRNGTFCDEAIAKEIYKESDACKEERLPRKERIYTLACCCCEKK